MSSPSPMLSDRLARQAKSRDDLSQPAIEHAERFWDAETENSRRYATQTNLLVTVVVAIAGAALAGLFRLATPDVVRTAWEHQIGQWLFLCAFFALVVGLGLLFWTLYLALSETRVSEIVQRAHPESTPQPELEAMSTASKTLRLPEPVIEELADRLPARRFILFAATYAAAVELSGRNTDRKAQLADSRRCAFAGLLCLVAATFNFWGFTLAFSQPLSDDSGHVAEAGTHASPRDPPHPPAGGAGGDQPDLPGDRPREGHR